MKLLMNKIFLEILRMLPIMSKKKVFYILTKIEIFSVGPIDINQEQTETTSSEILLCE